MNAILLQGLFASHLEFIKKYNIPLVDFYIKIIYLVLFINKRGEKLEFSRLKKYFHFVSITEYVYVCFSDDDECIAAQGGTPNWPFLWWNLAKRCLLGVHYPFRLETGAKTFRVSYTNYISECLIIKQHPDLLICYLDLSWRLVTLI